jgi:hypothetical protein
MSIRAVRCVALPFALLCVWTSRMMTGGTSSCCTRVISVLSLPIVVDGDGGVGGGCVDFAATRTVLRPLITGDVWNGVEWTVEARRERRVCRHLLLVVHERITNRSNRSRYRYDCRTSIIHGHSGRMQRGEVGRSSAHTLLGLLLCTATTAPYRPPRLAHVHRSVVPPHSRHAPTAADDAGARLNDSS